MSEYQYYEFRTIDSPLTAIQKETLSSISSRARVTSHTASFVYNYGSFHGDAEKLMTDCFDAMLYVSNWGSKRLIFRLPPELMDMKLLGTFSVSEEIDRRMTRDKKYVLLEFDFQEEEPGNWIEGDGWLDDLIGLREELLQGDLRGIYLAWLKAAETAFLIDNIDADTLEPPVPEGLNDLSPAQQALVQYLEINEAMIAVAAQKSGPQQKNDALENHIDKLPLSEQIDYLIRLSRGENNLSVLLNRRLLQLAGQKAQTGDNTDQRTISALVEASKVWHEEKKKEDQRQAELVRQQEIEALLPKENSVWREVDSYIKEKNAGAYKNAVKLLIDLRDLAEYQKNLKKFKERLNDIKKKCSNRPALISRMKEAKLIS